MEGAKHNLPDADSQKAAEAIKQLASELTEKDLLLVLISGKKTKIGFWTNHVLNVNLCHAVLKLCVGGGSALLPAPIPPISLQEKLDVTRRLAAAGATIQELNTVRRTLSLLKGGGLADCAHPAQVAFISKMAFFLIELSQVLSISPVILSSQVIALILSDVIGDPLDLIASGPTVWSEVWPEEVLSIFQRYKLLNSLPASVMDVLRRPITREVKDQSNVLNAVIGSNSLALKCAGRRARELGFRPVVLAPGVCGNVRSVSRLYGLLARFACSQDDPPPEIAAEVLRLGPEVGVESWDLCRTMQVLDEGRTEGWGATCLLAGGEPTVELTGMGQGGRNQELALRVGLELRGLKHPPNGPVFLSGGTDGQDGPTEAAGAITDAGVYEEALAQELDIESFLTNNDSYTFFTRLSAGQRLLVPGLTCTNVMDVHMLLIPPIPIKIR